MAQAAQPGNRDHARKLQHILRHAARVFCEKGYEGASIRDISRASGVSLSGLYYYFESKQQLLYLIQHHTFTSVLQRLEASLGGVTDPVDRLLVLVENHLDYFMSHPVEMKVLSHEDDALEGAFRREVATIKRRYYEIARGIFEGLRRSGRVRALNPRVTVLTLFGMMNWVYTWHNPKVDPGAASLAETLSGIFLEGVANGNGAMNHGQKSRRSAAGSKPGARRWLNGQAHLKSAG